MTLTRLQIFDYLCSLRKSLELKSATPPVLLRPSPCCGGTRHPELGGAKLQELYDFLADVSPAINCQSEDH